MICLSSVVNISKMTKLLIFVGYIALCVIVGKVEAAELKIEVTHPVHCTTKSKNGDNLFIHYTGTLVDGTVFDTSYSRHNPFEFNIGVGNVIKGWDQGLLDMCVGEKRKLTIPPELAYGDVGFDTLIPPGSTIIFDTELIKLVEPKDEL